MWKLQLWREIEFKIETVIEFVHYGEESMWGEKRDMHLMCAKPILSFTVWKVFCTTLHLQVMPGCKIISLK